MTVHTTTCDDCDTEEFWLQPAWSRPVHTCRSGRRNASLDDCGACLAQQDAAEAQELRDAIPTEALR